MKNKRLIKSINFQDSWSKVQNHVCQTNPHEPGSSRDALTHGISNFEYFLWSEEPIEIPIDIFSNTQIEYGLHKRNLKKYIKMVEIGSPVPPVIVTVDEGGNFHLVDGNHRVTALSHLGEPVVLAYIGISHENMKKVKLF